MWIIHLEFEKRIKKKKKKEEKNEGKQIIALCNIDLLYEFYS